MERPPTTAEQFCEELRAEAQLAKLDVVEELAALHDNEPLAMIREHLARQYRRTVGVTPENRHTFRGALQRIAAGGAQSVADVTDSINRQ